jgi:DNA modification methylase
MTKTELQKLELENNSIIKRFIKEYNRNKEPISISFRELLPHIKNNDRHTHLIHSYPAKLLLHIPFLFANNTLLSKPGDVILDPFAGTGTVLLEAILSGRHAIGADANPLARLIAEVKIGQFDIAKLKRTKTAIITRSRIRKKGKTPSVVNCQYWFPKKTINSLSKLNASIDGLKDENVKKFMLVSFSNLVKKVSYADSRISVPVKLNADRYTKDSKEHKRISAHIKKIASLDIFSKFEDIVSDNIARHEKFQDQRNNKYRGEIISDDARILTKSFGSTILYPDQAVQLIITSPPYAGAQKYIRASSLSLGWTNLAAANELLPLDGKSIGRENYRKSEVLAHETGIASADQLISEVFKIDKMRATIIGVYLKEMLTAFDEMIRVLKKGGYLTIIIGNNKVCGKEFNMQAYISEYLMRKKMKIQCKLIDDIRSYGLMTKRNKTADIISREWILVFKK